MKAPNHPRVLLFSAQIWKNKPTYRKNLTARISGILILVALITSGLYLGAAASGSRNSAPKPQGLAEGEVKTLPQVDLGFSSPFVNWLTPIAPIAPMMSPQATPVTVEIFAGDCTAPKTLFNRQDTDKIVCAKITNAMPGWQVIWSNGRNEAVQTTTLTSGNSDATFTLTSTSNLGDWRVILFDIFGQTVQVVTPFTVVDAANPVADLAVSTGAIAGSVSSGGQALFSVQVTNYGPSAATAVSLSDAVPTNAAFVSFAQLGGPTFTCTSPNVGETGTTVCTITSIGKGEKASFIAAYEVGAVANGTIISNTASISSNTTDPLIPNADSNNSSTAEVKVANVPCQLSTLENITVSADSGQAGAVVTYAAPTGTGDCGTTSVGENGESIPSISCNPPSGSFFSVGTTTVLCTARTGAAVSFQVTIDNPGALSVSLNDANSLTIECGVRFSDPGAAAIDGAGQPLAVTASYTGGYNPDAPAVGTYTATYTATEGANSVSANRTIIVADREGPAITVAGANPYRIQQGSCSPFVDPGASALDTCAGSKPVSSSISGPGGATSVNPSIPGSYIITYTATDGTTQSTATRTVIVGTFQEDEVDQPGSSNVPPTLALNGDDQITIECGTAFTDPGATATVCGSPVEVTTSGSVNINSPGVYSITYSATANGFTVDATRIVTVDADNTAPVIQLTGASSLTVECHTGFTDPGATAHDACAGNFAATPSGTVDPDTVGVYVITYNATDPSGHAATPVTRTVNVVDTTKPTVTPPVNVTVNTGPDATSCGTTVSDATLGTATATDSCAGALSVTRTGVPAGNVFPVGTTTITYTATDGYNTETATQTVTVVDNTPPVVTPPANITVFLPLNSTATSTVVDYPNPATATDNCPGTLNILYSPASGSTFPVGTTTVTASTTDAHGNPGSATFTVTVLYNFTGFFSPVDNLPTVNVVKAGLAVPVKFSLSGNKGLNIFAANSPYIVSINCDGSAPQNDIEETVNAGSSSLNYDAASDQYLYVWKTENSWKNTCRQLVVKLNDGSEHKANFKFK